MTVLLAFYLQLSLYTIFYRYAMNISAAREILCPKYAVNPLRHRVFMVHVV